MQIHGIDHFNIKTHNLDRLVEFYTGVLGFEVGERPPFDSPGVWLYGGGRALLHVGTTDGAATGDTWPLDHIALAVTGLDDTVRKLDDAGIEHRVIDVPGRAMKQIFVEDPDGVSIELNFSDPSDVGATR